MSDARPSEASPYESELLELDRSDHFINVAAVQAWYYLVTGVWPLVSISTFQLVTGPKTDLWLVRTVGLLITVIGAALLIASFRRRATLEIRLIAIGVALGLTFIDCIYVALGRIAPIYLLDAVLEVGLAVWWVILWRNMADSQGENIADTPQIYGDTVGRSYKVGGGLKNVGGEP